VKDDPVAGIYENEAGHYVDMTSPHLAYYVTADTDEQREEDEENIYEEIDFGPEALLACRGMFKNSCGLASSVAVVVRR
jgi:hypothetical protein